MKNCEQKAPIFLTKLLNILRSKENSKIISWDSQEKGIKINNKKRLEEQLLPRYFRHNKFTSFVRQLNMYDFHKVHLSDDRTIFYHSVFNPRNKSSILSIKRKVASQSDQNQKPTSQNKNKSKNEEPLQIYMNSNVEDLRNQSNHQLNQSSARRNDDFAARRSSFKLLFRNSLTSYHENQSDAQQVLEEIISQISPLKLSEESIREKICELRKFKKFRRFLKRGSFLCKIYAKLGIEMDREDDKLSQLSIEEDLMFDTKKSLTLRSLKMFDSGPINFKDTIGMFLN